MIAFVMENRYKLSMESKPSDDIVIEKMVRRIVDHSHPLKIILFGSRARGTARTDSDVDLLVVLSSVGSRTRAAAEIYGYLGAVGLSKDIVIFTPKELDEYKDVEGTVIKPALEEGKVLYERVA